MQVIKVWSVISHDTFNIIGQVIAIFEGCPTHSYKWIDVIIVENQLIWISFLVE
jgi:hypothetical protein